MRSHKGNLLILSCCKDLVESMNAGLYDQQFYNDHNIFLYVLNSITDVNISIDLINYKYNPLLGSLCKRFGLPFCYFRFLVFSVWVL